MRTIGILLVAACIVAGGVWLGWRSGNQPDRDALAAAREELGIAMERRFVGVGEVELHVVLAGPADGPPVVLLHGFPEFWYAWRGPMAVLARSGFRVIAPDQRGYNRSEKPAGVASYRLDRLAADVAGLIQGLGYESAFLAGHDWGGGVAWATVLDYPERVRRLAILDTPHPRAWEGFESGEDTVDWFRSFIQLPWIPEWSARVGGWRLLTRALRTTSREGTFPEAVLDQYRTAWDREGAFRTMAHWYRAPARPPRDGDDRVAVPTLLLLAPDDVYIPGDVSRRSALFLDAGRVVELATGSHWVIQEEPEEIGALLLRFFRESEPPGRRPATAGG